MKKILITGANGLLGNKLVSLLSQQQDVHLLATAKGICRFFLPDNVMYRTLDITNADACKNLFNEFQPDALIHAAAMTQVDACEDDREACDLINISGVSNLINAIGNRNTHFVHISTDFIYEGNEEEYFEGSKVNPLNYYGISKWKSEQLFEKVSFPYSILRTVLVYGVLQDLSRTNIVLWAKAELEKGEKINVVNDQFRCPTLAEDLACACLQVIQENATGVYHVCGKDFLSILDIVFEIANYWGLDESLINSISSVALNQRARRPSKTNLNLSKAKQVFNYQPKSFREGLKLLDEQMKKVKK